MKKIFVVFIIVLVIVGARVKYRLPIDVPTPVVEETWVVDENGVTKNIAKDQNGPWLAPDDFLTEEERTKRQEFYSNVAKAMKLDSDSPEFRQEMERLYSTTSSDEFPSYDVYKLFVDYRYGEASTPPRSTPEPPAPEWGKDPEKPIKKSACE